MMNFQLGPVVVLGGGSRAAAPAKQPRKPSDILNEMVVVAFFSLGAALGAAVFLMWFGGLVWGLVSSFFR